MGHLQLLWTTCTNASPPPIVKNLFLVFDLNLLSFTLKSFPLVLSLHASANSLCLSFCILPSGTIRPQLGHPQFGLCAEFSEIALLG